MSLSKIITEHCPSCKSPQEIRLHETVNVTIDPHLKSEVLSGKLNTSICSNCNQEISILSGLIYHDMRMQLMIELKVTDADLEDGKKEIIDGLIEQGYIYRIVESYAELIEKITVFDNKLNDLVISNVCNRLKGFMNESLFVVKNLESGVQFQVYFKGIEKSIFKKKLMFYCFTHPQQMMEVSYDFKKLTSEEKTDLYNLDSLRFNSTK